MNFQYMPFIQELFPTVFSMMTQSETSNHKPVKSISYCNQWSKLVSRVRGAFTLTLNTNDKLKLKKKKKKETEHG